MAIGDLLATISVTGSAGATIALASNPSGYFSLSGVQILDATGTIPTGTPLPLSISATALGIPTVYPFLMTIGGPGGPMDFSVPGNLPESPAGATI